MDKYIRVLLIVLLITTASIAGRSEKNEQQLPHDSLTGKISFEGVELIDSSINKNILYIAARSWFAISFKSSTDVIQMEDKDAGKIIGKGNVILDLPQADEYSRLSFTITIQIKHGRYKYTITDFQLCYGPIENTKNGNYRFLPNIYTQTETKVKELLASLKNAMVSANKSENW